MTAPQQALLASMRGGRVWVPYATADEVVALRVPGMLLKREEPTAVTSCGPRATTDHR